MLRAPSRGILVSEAARRCQVTPRAIRFYEDQGLIRSGRGAGGQRLFDEPTLDRLQYIADARRMGLTVNQVHDLLYAGDHHGEEARAARLLAECRRRLEEIAGQKALVEATIAGLDAPAQKHATLRMAG